MSDVSCKSLGMNHDWRRWTRSSAEPHREIRTCKRCGVREYRAVSLIITDGHGYWCGRRRDKADKTRKVDFWSSKKADAARMHFYEVAQQIAAGLPMQTRIATVRK